MDYRNILSDQFQLRRRVNPRYSLRAFARDISISPSRLSEVISGKGELSREKAEIITRKLCLPPIVAADFMDLIEAAVAPLESARLAALKRLETRKSRSVRRRFEESQFDLIADPKYLVVWTFMSLPNYTGCPEFIAEHLKIDLFDVFEALRRLEALGLVRYDKGFWSFVKGQFTTGDRAPSAIVRAYHESLSQLGRLSINQQSLTERHLDSLVIPFDSSRLGEVKQRIADFTQSLIDDFGTGVDSVYGMSLQFFRMAGPVASKSNADNGLN
jgi:uncharacterized protein (TIGR02147 family)